MLASVSLSAFGAESTRSLESLLEDLSASGIEVIYSSNLVPPDLSVAVDDAERDPLQRARRALAAHDLELREIAPRRYVVVRRERRPDAEPITGPLEEISVYASRFALAGRTTASPLTLEGTEIHSVPGTHDDALRALKALPGVANNVSARPHIRGSMSQDVLVRYDGITLLDPYHLKNFQSLISAIDPAAIESIEVFSGGFPVQHGTRSGGVINVTAPTMSAGYEHRISASAISAGLSTRGHARDWPLEWFAAVRRSTLDLLEVVEKGFGDPRFGDSLGRMRWQTDNGAWTAGWLLLDDRLRLGSSDDEEFALARYRDEYAWLAREHRFGDSLETRVNAVVASADRSREGAVDSPGVVVGSLYESQHFDRFELNNGWTYLASPHSNYSLGAELALSRTNYRYGRELAFGPEVANAFGRAPVETLQASIRPEVITYAVYGANRRRWSSFEVELGVRVDGQDFADLGHQTQVSPRLNLRYDMSQRMRLYASFGRFTQAQHIEEWRVEEAQARADAAQSAIHSVLGITYETSNAARLSIEAYDKHWTRVAPYFDSTMNPLSLLPDLAPDRIRLTPKTSESTGIEFNGRMPLFEGANVWGSMSWSHVADQFGGHEVLRSWDQSFAMTAGFNWEGSRLSLSALGGWHRGWPRTPVEARSPNGTTPGTILLGPRNSRRWQNFYTLDLRAAWTWRFEHGDLSTVFEVTNATDRSNPCCSKLEMADDGVFLQRETEHWLPAIVNLGFVYRWRDAH